MDGGEAWDGVDGVDPVAPCEDLGETTGDHWYVNSTVDDIYRRWDEQVSPEDMRKCEAMVRSLMTRDPVPSSERELIKAQGALRKEHKIVPKKSWLLLAYNNLVASGELQPNPVFRSLLVHKAMKSQSGIISVTVLTSPYPSVPGQAGPPQQFSCKWDCHYCPNQPGQPRSYLRDEPAVRRANQNRFDPVLQFTDRAATLAMNGHPVDKIELLVLGGTWHSYPLAYQEMFVRDLFYAANTFRKRLAERRRPRSLEEELLENESAECKIIGLTLETRPDCIDAAELRRLRRYGCTRVQLGVQHVDDGILRHVNRGHDCFAVEEALRLLKDSCYKIDIHLMPNLPGSSPEVDAAMFDRVLSDEALQADQWKIYPCTLVPWTRIKQWFDEGTYVPYPERELVGLLSYVKAKVHPWIRLNRVIRDIPDLYIKGGLETTNLREHVLAEMRKQGKRCRCIRCREIGDLGGWQQSAGSAGAGKSLGGRLNRDGVLSQRVAEEMRADAALVVRTYQASGGTEHFISYEAGEERLFGFARLRISRRTGFPSGLFPELQGCGLIRELHVYGQMVASDARGDGSGQASATTQHAGFGSLLMQQAERMAWDAGLRSTAVIAGIGTRNYYRRLGYELHPGDGGFMIKRLRSRPPPPAIGRRIIGARWRLRLQAGRSAVTSAAPLFGAGAAAAAAGAFCAPHLAALATLPLHLRAAVLLAALAVFAALYAAWDALHPAPPPPPRPPSLQGRRRRGR